QDDADVESNQQVLESARSGMWHFSSVRENAAWTIAALLFHHPEELDLLKGALSALSQDRSPRVRATAAWAFKYLLVIDAGLAIDLFLASMAGNEVWWGVPPVEDFLHSAVL